MAMTGIAAFDRTVQKTNEWLNELTAFHDGLDREKAYLVLRASLHALRDRLTPEEAAQLGAQLPMLIRGFYYEGWRPTGKPVKQRHKEEFLAQLEKALDGYGLGRAEDIARIVFRLLDRRISAGEMEDVRQGLPREIRDLFNGGRTS
jgi:uncharacterized protein (DUF2267 family)